MSGAGTVLPVGFRLGPETLPEPFADTVRLGWQRLGLGPDEARVWDLAHEQAGDDADGRGDLLLERATAAGVRAPEDVVAALEARSLLVRVPAPGADPEALGALEALSRRLLARPLLVGLGPGREPGTTVLGTPGRPVLELPRAVALRWEVVGVAADLWAGAGFALRAAAPPGTADPDRAQVASAARAVLADLPTLLAHHCGYLDLVV